MNKDLKKERPQSVRATMNGLHGGELEIRLGPSHVTEERRNHNMINIYLNTVEPFLKQKITQIPAYYTDQNEISLIRSWSTQFSLSF